VMPCETVLNLIDILQHGSKKEEITNHVYYLTLNEDTNSLYYEASTCNYYLVLFLFI